jgi:hypothetical protein
MWGSCEIDDGMVFFWTDGSCGLMGVVDGWMGDYEGRILKMVLVFWVEFEYLARYLHEVHRYIFPKPTYWFPTVDDDDAVSVTSSDRFFSTGCSCS